ncbi:MAG: hypothetical protein ABIJ97_05875 [Bacteroidota bacterium]
MSIEIKEVKNNADKKAFVNFQFDLYKRTKIWVPPLKSDELKMLSSETNPAMEFCDTKFWLAIKNGKVSGRIGAIVNKAYNEKISKKMGRISRLEFIKDDEVLKSLLSTAEDWLKEKGMDMVHGPLGFSNLDTQGMLIEGFDYLPSIASVFNMEYYQEMIEKHGYEKEIDWIEFRLTIGEQAVNKASRGAELIAKRYGMEVLHYTKTSELIPYGKRIFEILNDAFDVLPFVAKLTPKMIDLYSEKYIRFLNPEFVKIVKTGDEIVGFIIGMPSLSKAMQKAGGKLFPFGFWHIIKARKATNNDTLDQLLTGVVPEYQSKGAAVILFSESQNTMIKKGMKYIETTGVFETNHNVITNWKNYDHIQHKRRRCFIKNL